MLSARFSRRSGVEIIAFCRGPGLLAPPPYGSFLDVVVCGGLRPVSSLVSGEKSGFPLGVSGQGFHFGFPGFPPSSSRCNRCGRKCR